MYYFFHLVCKDHTQCSALSCDTWIVHGRAPFSFKSWGLFLLWSIKHRLLFKTGNQWNVDITVFFRSIFYCFITLYFNIRQLIAPLFITLRCDHYIFFSGGVFLFILFDSCMYSSNPLEWHTIGEKFDLFTPAAPLYLPAPGSR